MTTNNHPANGPVSLDRLHQIREILSKAAAQSDGGNLGYAMADAVKVIDGAIAAYGAEPVGTFKKGPCGYYSSFHEDAVPLYTAPQPTPVVPPAIEPDYEVIKAILPTSNPDEYACCIAADMWNACRSAMLAAAPQPALDSEAQITLKRLAVILHGSETDLNLLTVTAQSLMDRCKAGNSQVTPDSWIPVSERMPEWSDDVLCATEFDGPGNWRKKVGYWHQGRWVIYDASWTPTYWMPLPAAPQQEVK
ncbi:DUF551 domain-containing protein [Salmonella enterica]|nr:DUF551 domain-containing protein [Salmonella enterica]EGI9508478.1 DUF551 domain-containing protein [Salmonella enterica]